MSHSSTHSSPSTHSATQEANGSVSVSIDSEIVFPPFYYVPQMDELQPPPQPMLEEQHITDDGSTLLVTGVVWPFLPQLTDQT